MLKLSIPTGAAMIAFLAIHPSRPLKMRTEHLEVKASDGVVLAATLQSPRWQEPIGALVLVHGSGPLTREHVRGDARDLVRNGFMVLTYDKRGCGGSGGTYRPSSEHPMTTIIDELARDAQVMLTTLRSTISDPSLACGYFGASQAGWIIPLASSRADPPADFHIILSGPAMSSGLEGRYSELTGDGASFTDTAGLALRLQDLSGPIGFNPVPLWEQLHVPTLWLLGDRDGSVPTSVTVANLDTLIQNGHTEHRVVRFPNAGHDLRDVTSDEPVALWERLMTWWPERNRK
jgi:uncharacterized protein